MRTKSSESDLGSDLFRCRLDNLIDMRHELVRLSEQMTGQCLRCNGETCSKISEAHRYYHSADCWNAVPETYVQTLR
jgi:hypothetical protein